MSWCTVMLALNTFWPSNSEVVLLVVAVEDQALRRHHPNRRLRPFLDLAAFVPEAATFEISIIVSTMLFQDVQDVKAVAYPIQNANQVCAAALRRIIMVVVVVVMNVRGGVFPALLNNLLRGVLQRLLQSLIALNHFIK